MAIISLSRGSYSRGKEIAEAVAQRFGHDCVSREILIAAPEHFNIPEFKLVRSLHDAPSVLERFSYDKERYLSFLQCEFLRHARKDNMVYHGLVGHFMVRGVSHLLKVRILAEIEDRVRLEMQREKVSQDEALRVLRKDDDERRKWAMAVWGKDPWDPGLYDMILHIHRLTVEDVVDLICHAAQLRHFLTTPESRKKVDDLWMAAEVKSRIVARYPASTVSADRGSVTVNVTADLVWEPSIVEEVKKLTEGLEGLKDMRVSVTPVGL